MRLPDTNLLLNAVHADSPQHAKARHTLEEVLDDPRGGFLRVAVASPRAGAELYCMLALERACAQGNYRLPPNAFTVLDGFTAAEALTSKAEVERVKVGAIF